MTTIALINETGSRAIDDLLPIFREQLQRQVSHYLAPTWGPDAAIQVHPSVAAMPDGAWPIRIRHDIADGNDGVHRFNGRPYALVRATALWTLAASHECIEMLCDPAGDHIRPAATTLTGGREVYYLIEPCDPCQDPAYAYKPRDDIWLSDFYYPAYLLGHPYTQFSYSGAITAPLQLLGPHGYAHCCENGTWFRVNAGAPPELLGPRPPDIHGATSLRRFLHPPAPRPADHWRMRTAAPAQAPSPHEPPLPAPPPPRARRPHRWTWRDELTGKVAKPGR